MLHQGARPGLLARVLHQDFNFTDKVRCWVLQEGPKGMTDINTGARDRGAWLVGVVRQSVQAGCGGGGLQLSMARVKRQAKWLDS